MWDSAGDKYLDCLSAYVDVNQGHNHPLIQAALVKQSRKISITSRAFYNEELGPFLEKLCHLYQMDMALPMNTGAEAVESAIKVARNWGYKSKGVPDGKAEIITCQNNFHGRTTIVISFSTDPIATEGFTPLTPGFKSIPFGDIEALEKAITKNTVAFLVEPIQGKGGIIIPPKGYLKKEKDLCAAHNVLFILDEIQTGLGRTGKLFAYQHDDAKPDLLLLGKALSGGMYPVSAVVDDRRILSLLPIGSHSSTYGGNPLACGISTAALDVIVSEKLPEASAEMGRYFLEELKKIDSPFIKIVRGRGLMIAIDFKKNAGTAQSFAEKLMPLGILCKGTKEQTLRFTPPIIISKAEIDWCIKRLRLILDERP